MKNEHSNFRKRFSVHSEIDVIGNIFLIWALETTSKRKISSVSRFRFTRTYTVSKSKAPIATWFSQQWELEEADWFDERVAFFSGWGTLCPSHWLAEKLGQNHNPFLMSKFSFYCKSYCQISSISTWYSDGISQRKLLWWRHQTRTNLQHWKIDIFLHNSNIFIIF